MAKTNISATTITTSTSTSTSTSTTTTTTTTTTTKLIIRIVVGKVGLCSLGCFSSPSQLVRPPVRSNRTEVKDIRTSLAP